MAKKKGPKQMSAEHKAALAAGRTEGRAVKAYLEALDAARPKRGRRRSPERIQARLAEISELLPSADPMTRLSLVQERNDLEGELAQSETETDLSALEAAFTEVAKAYSDRKGIGYAAWREVGVPASVLREAGVSRSA